jgi:hypothetical protein
MKCHDISCTHLIPYGATGTRSCTVKDKIKTCRWKGTHACDYGLHLEVQTHHDAVQTSTNSSLRLPPPPALRSGWRVDRADGVKLWVGVSEEVKIITAVSFSLFLYFPFLKERCPMRLVSIVYSYIYMLHLLKSGGEFAVGTHILDQRIRLMKCLYNFVNCTL